MDFDIDSLTLLGLLTTAGAAMLAAIVTGLTSLVATLFPASTGHQSRIAALIALAFVVVLAVQGVTSGIVPVDARLILVMVIAWYFVTRGSMALYDDIKAKPRSLRNPSPR